MSRTPDFTGVPLTDLWSLTGKVAVVTGGGSGMGQATAVRFAEAGATVVVADIAPDHAAETLAMIAEHSPGAVTDSIQVDITDPDDVRALGDAVAERHGGIDLWVNTAFVQSSSGIVDYPDEMWRAGLAINLDGSFYCAREAAKHMVAGERRGVIILVTSGSAHHGRGRRYQYVAAKHGTLGLVRSLALELGPLGIRAVAIAPAATDTPGFRGGRQKYAGVDAAAADKQLQDTIQAMALGRLGKADDIARAALFAASDMGAFVTGSTIHVDGGVDAG